MLRVLKSAAFSSVLVASAVSACAQAVISLPGNEVQLGVNELGALGAGSTPAGSNASGLLGIYLTAQRADGITPGCFCEGWGVAANSTTAGYVGNSNGGTSNISAVSFSSTAHTATSVTQLGGTGLQISQAFAPSAASTTLFDDKVTLTNTGTAAISNVQYSRAMDWDINPTEFNEYVTVGGIGASALQFSNDDGFCVPNPLGSCASILSGTTNVNFTKLGPADQGSFFTFGFGGLDAGASKTFDIFYGAGANEAAAIAGLSTVGAEVYALGYASDGPGGTADVDSGVWAFGFSGVGGTPIGPPPPPPPTGVTPEPSSIALAATGLLGAIGGIRRKLRA